LSYTQPPRLTEDEIDIFLNEQKIAKICTLNKDRTVHATAVWFLYKNGSMIMCTPAATRKVKNIVRNNNVTVLVDDPETPRGVLIYGKAKLESEYSFRVAASLYEKYVSIQQAAKLAREMSRISKGGAVMITVKADRMISYDNTKDTLLKLDAEK